MSVFVRRSVPSLRSETEQRLGAPNHDAALGEGRRRVDRLAEVVGGPVSALSTVTPFMIVWISPSSASGDGTTATKLFFIATAHVG